MEYSYQYSSIGCLQNACNHVRVIFEHTYTVVCYFAALFFFCALVVYVISGCIQILASSQTLILTIIFVRAKKAGNEKAE